MRSNRPEIAYLIQNILPLLTEQFDFPRQENEKLVKIDEIPVQMGSGVKKPDIVYYHDNLPVALLEAKKPDKNLEKTLEQAMSYAKLYPVENYSNGLVKPKIIIISIGHNLNWYRRWVELVGDESVDHYEKIESLTYDEVLAEYGLIDLGKKRVLKAAEFRSELVGDLVAVYKKEETITPDIVSAVALQILAWLEWGGNYTAHEPYISLEGEHERQAQIRGLYKNIDIVGSLGPDAARAFRQFVLRAFQGQYNQYLTHQAIISFMYKLVAPVGSETKILDFECGSGGYLASAVDSFGVKLESIRGVDIDPLPYTIAKAYLAIYFGVDSKEKVDSLPIKLDNGLFFQGDDWDLIIGNPAGGSKYDDTEPKRNDIAKVLENLQSDLDNNGRPDIYSEYNFSIQQSIQSAKVGAKICLILPEGLFANSSDGYLRKYITKHCKVMAIVSLPRGVFRRGTSTRGQNSGSSTSSQKMSILYLQKQQEVIPGSTLDEQPDLEYPVFLAQISERSGSGDLDKWLEEVLNVVADQWQSWHKNGKLIEIPTIKIETVNQQTAGSMQLDLSGAEEHEELKKPEAPEAKTETKVDVKLKGLFGKFKVDN